MRDTTQIEIISSQLDKIADAIAKPSTGTSTGTIALYAAMIGACAAILSQVIIFLLNRYKERNNLREELIAEERRISYLLTEYYKDLVMHKVHKQYWYRTSEVHNPGTEDSKDSHRKHFESNQKSFETMGKIRVIMSDYFKVVTHFTNQTGKNKIIENNLIAIKKFQPRKASTFSEVDDYSALLVAQSKEEENLNKEYLFYSNCFDRINAEMIKKSEALKRNNFFSLLSQN
ncbi:MAG: hypothetical protein IBJ09_15725 [Bacteroidia bacterium]|nr:hypothetical protein [Bacteroidia bacterium]